jgi:hypothetical protein
MGLSLEVEMKMQVLVAGLLVVAGRSAAAQGQPAAQAGDSVPMEIVFVVFPDTTAADSAMANLNASQRGHVESYQVVSENQSGTVTSQGKHVKAGNSAATQRASSQIDGVVALLGEKPQRDTSGAGRNASKTGRDTSKSGQDTSARGYAPGNAGGNTSGVSSADMSRMQDMLTPGQAAIVLVVDNPYGKDVQTALQGDNGTGGLVIQLAPQ